MEKAASKTATEATELESVLSEANLAGQEDFLKFLLGETDEAPHATSDDQSSEGQSRLRLYDDRKSLLEGYGDLADGRKDYVATEENGELMMLTAPKDLRRRLGSSNEPGGRSIRSNSDPGGILAGR